MRITDILDPELVVPRLNADDKSGTLHELSDPLARYISTQQSGLPPDKHAQLSKTHIANALLERERLGSTGVGEGVAIPHTKIPGLSQLTAAFGRSEKGIAFEAIDNQPVKLVFVLLVPQNSAGAHLKALARISRMLKNTAFREKLTLLDQVDSLFDAFLSEDSRH